jgi:hypothetical protein
MRRDSVVRVVGPWAEKLDPDSRRLYYAHLVTQESRWDKPSEVPLLEVRCALFMACFFAPGFRPRHRYRWNRPARGAVRNSWRVVASGFPPHSCGVLSHPASSPTRIPSRHR